jgi:alkanesulfonate monooxygenase SsuD/methylene tetrahydromethanopterin reductase-like flavin-dependent oxidoreductase (luciferase family)
MFGTPDQAIKKLKLYELMGVDQFLYFASMGLDLAAQKRSLELFCKEVMPVFSDAT